MIEQQNKQTRSAPGSKPKRVVAPEASYRRPLEVAEDSRLDRAQKLEALERWDEAAQLRLAATDEGMPANGTTTKDLDTLNEIERARRRVTGAEPQQLSRDARVRPASPPLPSGQVGTVEARQASRTLVNYRVLVNSLLIVALFALAWFAATWWLLPPA